MPATPGSQGRSRASAQGLMRPGIPPSLLEEAKQAHRSTLQALHPSRSCSAMQELAIKVGWLEVQLQEIKKEVSGACSQA